MHIKLTKLAGVLFISLSLFVPIYTRAQAENRKTDTKPKYSTQHLLDSIAQLQLEILLLENSKNKFKVFYENASYKSSLLSYYSQLREAIEANTDYPQKYNLYTKQQVNDSSYNFEIHFNADNKCRECIDLFLLNNSRSQLIFPLVSKGIKNGTIVLDTHYTVNKSQVIRIPDLSEFRYNYNAQQNRAEKISLLERCLERIKEISATNFFDSDVYSDYLEVEKQKIPNDNLDGKIQLRLNFIKLLENKIKDARKKYTR